MQKTSSTACSLGEIHWLGILLGPKEAFCADAAMPLIRALLLRSRCAWMAAEDFAFSPRPEYRGSRWSKSLAMTAISFLVFTDLLLDIPCLCKLLYLNLAGYTMQLVKHISFFRVQKSCFIARMENALCWIARCLSCGSTASGNAGAITLPDEDGAPQQHHQPRSRWIGSGT